MAPWYELVLACDLKVNTPQQVIDVLEILCSPESMLESSLNQTSEYEQFVVPDHPYFRVEGRYWPTLLMSKTYYFHGDVFSKLTYNETLKCYRFTTRATVRRGADRIASFLHWLAPYSETNEFVGYTRCDEIPDLISLIYFEHGTAWYKRGDFSGRPPGLLSETITLDELDPDEDN